MNCLRLVSLVVQSYDLISSSLAPESVPLINIIKCQFLFITSSFYSSVLHCVFSYLGNFGDKIIYILIFMVLQKMKIKNILGHDFYLDWDIQSGTGRILICLPAL